MPIYLTVFPLETVSSFTSLSLTLDTMLNYQQVYNKCLWIQQVINYTLDQYETAKKDYFDRRKQQQPIPLPTFPLQKIKGKYLNL